MNAWHLIQRSMAAGGCALGLLAAAGAAQPASSEPDDQFSYTNLHEFNDLIDGRHAPRRPSNGLLLASDGYLYGLSTRGGDRRERGAIFRISPDGGEVDQIQHFHQVDGLGPVGRLLETPDGHFYGVTYEGGHFTHGTVFHMHPHGRVTTLHDFEGYPGDGRGPLGPPILASDGWFYGTTGRGGKYGTGDGVAYRFKPGGAWQVLHMFSSHDDGENPMAPLVEAPDGLFYGVTLNGGLNNLGTLFRIAADGSFEVLHHFGPNLRGARPTNPLMRASDGQLYGTTSENGDKGHGTVFRVGPDGLPQTLHAIDPIVDGMLPSGAATEGSDGFLYIPLAGGGKHDGGSVIRVDPATGHTTLAHAFVRRAGGHDPQGTLAADADGNLFGTTLKSRKPPEGRGEGAVFRLTPK